MKKMKLALFAVAIIAIGSAFATKSVLADKRYAILQKITAESRYEVDPTNLVGVSHTCLNTSSLKCTIFFDDAQASDAYQDVDGKWYVDFDSDISESAQNGPVSIP